MGWIALLALGIGAMAGLVMLGVPRLLWSLIGAVLMLAAAGYALQGRPMLAASAATGRPPVVRTDDGLNDLRDAMFGRFTGDGAYLVAADAMTRANDPHAAAQVILAGIHKVPASALLWTGLGTALAAHDGTLSPPARFAFDHAIRLAPEHPGPVFFLGLAQVRAGQFAAARPSWVRALTLTPPGAPCRQPIRQRLALLDTYLAASGER